MLDIYDMLSDIHGETKKYIGELMTEAWEPMEGEDTGANTPEVLEPATEEPATTPVETEDAPVEAEEAPEDNIQTKKTKESLKCQLSDKEILELGKQSARVGSAIRQKESELQAVKSQFKAELDKLVAERNELETKINAGWEFRTVDCEIIKDFRENTLRVVRLDTFDTVRERTLTAEERQHNLI